MSVDYIHVPGGVGQSYEDYFFPIQAAQVRNLVGKILTHIEAMNLPARVEKANKDLVRQRIWDWWSESMHNSTSSAGGCIGPIEYVREALTSDEKPNRYVWHTRVGELEPQHKDGSLEGVWGAAKMVYGDASNRGADE